MELIKFKHFKAALTCQPYFIWHQLAVDAEKDDDEDIGQNLWNQEIVEADSSIGQVIAKTFTILEQKIKTVIRQEFATVTLSGSIENRILQTQQLLNSQKVIINPVFIWEGVIATPFAFDTKNKRIFNISYSGKTKAKNLLQAFYDFEILKRNNISVNDYYLYLPQDVYCQRHEMEIIATNKCHVTKQGAYPGTTNARGQTSDVAIIEQLTSLKTKVNFPLFDDVIKQIKQAQEAQVEANFSKDVTFWGFNPQWDALLAHFKHPFAYLNGKIFGKKAIANNDLPLSKVYQHLQKLTQPAIINPSLILKMLSQIENSAKIIWYDFEGYSLPFAALDNTKPYRQVVFQVSVIVTKQLKEEKPQNYLYDPKTLNKDDFYHIIENVYQQKGDLYIVYNQAYENTRLKEMVELLEREQDARAQKARAMYEHIIAHTLDLYDGFKINSRNVLPPILLHDQKGKASIKNIEKHINTNKLSTKIGYQILPYQFLTIQKGTMAMDVAIKRALNIIGDQEWIKTRQDLQIYCENDVRAMIMVYYFIKYLLKEHHVKS